MPPTNVKNIAHDFLKKAITTTMFRLFWFIFIFVPLILRFCLSFSQLGYTV